MTDRMLQGWRRLLGLAAAPGRALSALEPTLSWDERFSPELGLVEANAQALLTPLLSPALGEAGLERAVARLTAEEGEAALPVGSAARTEEGVPAQEAPRRRRAAAAVRKGGAREKPTLASPGISPEHLEQMASLTDAQPSRRRPGGASAAASPGAVASPLQKRTARQKRTVPRTAPAERPGDAVPPRKGAKVAAVSAVEASARLKQRAERAGVAQALDTPVVVEEVAQAAVSQVATSRAEGLPGASVAQRIDRALERLEPRRHVARGPEQRERTAVNAEEEREEGRGEGITARKGGLAGLAARAAGSSLPATNTGSQPATRGRPSLASSPSAVPSRVSPVGRPVPQGPATLPLSSAQPPPVPAVLAERMEELKLTQQLDRILRREAERAGIDLEGLDP
ncbi:hypothetical protein [Hyalangium sp.]|uniref:hypothetical protein n=1 Tax=Hyalangium sp. TaxID=2028555 RepID=UPI002D401054|nr:hypothetical protein [Hyalangium sp.]HYH96891.1 hypothetical protein [Hyalangium sp.]